jgi:hypothetical protein
VDEVVVEEASWTFPLEPPFLGMVVAPVACWKAEEVEEYSQHLRRLQIEYSV